MAGRNIGAFWKPKEGSKAALTGTIEVLGVQVRISMFKNEKKEKDTHPDYNIVSYGIVLPKPETQAESTPADDSSGLPF